MEEEKKEIQLNFSQQLQRVNEDFQKLSEISLAEQTKLEERVAELQTELETANQSNVAAAALDHKKKLDSI